jgi:molybdenum cofactor synthesis domain-containing protein
MWMLKKFKYIPLEEVHRLIREITGGKAGQEVISVFHAYNRVLAEDITSDVNIPPVSISHFDGYAIRAEDSSEASIDSPVSLRVVGRSYLNEEYEGGINVGEAAYVSTGCKLPTGANAVIPVEVVKDKGDAIEVRKPVRPYENVVAVGMDVKKGEAIFKAGHVLRAQDIKFLMEIKKWKVEVFKKPVVAIISVGDELTSRIEETDVKKFDSHGEMISILAGEAGGVPLNLGIAPDDVNAIKKLLREGMERADVIATVGGASVGERDHVWEAINQLGKVIIRGIRVQPGRVTSLGVVRDKPVVMLPGHVQSTLAGFCLVLLPLIRQMGGFASAFSLTTLSARMSQKILLKEFASFKRVRFVKVTKVNGDYIAEPILGDSSLISIVVKANGFIVVPERKEAVEGGEEVNVHLLDGLFPLA